MKGKLFLVIINIDMVINTSNLKGDALMEENIYSFLSKSNVKFSYIPHTGYGAKFSDLITGCNNSGCWSILSLV